MNKTTEFTIITAMQRIEKGVIEDKAGTNIFYKRNKIIQTYNFSIKKNVPQNWQLFKLKGPKLADPVYEHS